MAPLLYCERGGAGAAGVAGSSAFFSVSSRPPEVGGASGAPLCDIGAVVPGRIEVGLRS
jgi:hypothetical protein